jgi:flagellar biosynthesis protein FlhG
MHSSHSLEHRPAMNAHRIASGEGAAAAAIGAPSVAFAPVPYVSRVIAVTSGKGGVGKTVLAANLGLAMAAMGRRVLLVDADLSLANLDLMLGLKARSTISDFLNGAAPLEDVLLHVSDQLALLPACSGEQALAELSHADRQALFTGLEVLEAQFDTVIVDTGAGIGSNAVAFALAAHQVLVVLTPDPTSLADAYAMIKVLSLRGLKDVQVCVNMVNGTREVEQTLDRLFDLVDRFLDIRLAPIGYVYQDDAVVRSVRACTPLLPTYPRALASIALSALAQRVLEHPLECSSAARSTLLWRRLVGEVDTSIPVCR